CGLLQSDQKEFSPVFLQFLESIWQLLQQFPFSFQFNERFLLTLHDHVYSCQFGTFLGNCQKERRDLGLPKRTYSLWGYMWQNISDYANPLYREVTQDDALWPDTSPQAISTIVGIVEKCSVAAALRDSARYQPTTRRTRFLSANSATREYNITKYKAGVNLARAG
ncbi:predicted protein, partial [Nematostella vectensis]